MLYGVRGGNQVVEVESVAREGASDESSGISPSLGVL